MVNNAGYALMGPLEGVTPEQLERQFQTNVLGVVSVIQEVLPILRQQGNGTIVNVASIGGRLAFPLATSYHASKWAVDGLSEALRYELQPFGIRVKIIEPGGIKTDFINRGTTWATHPTYADMIARVKGISERLDATMPGPEGVAKTIIQGSARPLAKAALRALWSGVSAYARHPPRRPLAQHDQQLDAGGNRQAIDETL